VQRAFIPQAATPWFTPVKRLNSTGNPKYFLPEQIYPDISMSSEQPTESWFPEAICDLSTPTKETEFTRDAIDFFRNWDHPSSPSQSTPSFPRQSTTLSLLPNPLLPPAPLPPSPPPSHKVPSFIYAHGEARSSGTSAIPSSPP